VVEVAHEVAAKNLSCDSPGLYSDHTSRGRSKPLRPSAPSYAAVITDDDHRGGVAGSASLRAAKIRHASICKARERKGLEMDLRATARSERPRPPRR